MPKSLRLAAFVAISVAVACAPHDADDAASGATTAVISNAGASTVATNAGSALPTVTVYKSPTCGCCNAWVDHMKHNGFQVVAIDTTDMESVKRTLGVHQGHGSCHTATVDGYVLEGHVPAADVKKLLTERPTVVGLAVPGMPAGSPGMEVGYSDKYDVLAFDKQGQTKVFSSH